MNSLLRKLFQLHTRILLTADSNQQEDHIGEDYVHLSCCHQTVMHYQTHQTLDLPEQRQLQ